MRGSAGLMIGACGLALLAGSSESVFASIVYRDIPDITLQADWSVLHGDLYASLDANGDGVDDFSFHVFWSSVGGFIQESTSVATLGGSATVNGLAGLTNGPRRLDDGYVIGPGSATWGPGGTLRNPGEVTSGFWNGAGYLAFSLPVGGGVQYGWVSMYAVGDSISVFSLAYEDQVNTPIAAGAVPGPGSGALLLGASGAAGLRRRR
jgi:hypothetical protein